jgi:hypothetical protein
MRIQELITLGTALVVLGIIFGEDRLIGCLFISVGVSLSMVSVIKSRKRLTNSKSSERR